MISEFERKGKWWLPDNPDHKLVGTLTYSPRDGGVLELTDGFAGFEELEAKGWVLPPRIILGVELDGSKITLLHCALKASFIGGGGYATCSFSAQVVCLGAHYATPQEMTFDGLSVYYSHLNEWADQSFFEVEKEGGLSRITHRRPKEVLAVIDDRIAVSIGSLRLVSWDYSPPRGVSVEYDANIGLELPHKASLAEYMRVSRIIQVFLALAVGEAVHPLRITSTQRIQLADNRTAHLPLEIRYRLPRLPSELRRLSSSDMLFTLADIADRFDSVLNKWFENAVLLEPVYNLYIGTLSTPRMSEEPRFLSLTQAMESFHRRRCGGAYLSRDEYTPVCERLVESIPESVAEPHRDALKTRLFYGNEFSFRKRLEAIFDKHQEVLGLIVEDSKSFVFEVKQTRNYLTHYDEDIKREGGVADGADLYLLGQKLASVLEICLLAELGFSMDEQKRQAGIIASRRSVERVDWS